MRLKKRGGGAYLHNIVLPHVGKVSVAVAMVQSPEVRCGLIRVHQGDEGPQPVEEARVAKGAELIQQDGLLILLLTRTHVQHADLVSFVPEANL